MRNRPEPGVMERIVCELAVARVAFNLFLRVKIREGLPRPPASPKLWHCDTALAPPEPTRLPLVSNKSSKAWPREHWIALTIMACTLVLAWIHLCNSSIWYDEAITLLTTSGHAKLDWPLGLVQFNPTLDLGKILSDLYDQDVHPPLYFWTLAIWRFFLGPSLEVARSFSALLTVGMLALLYRLARDEGMLWPWVPVAIYAASSVGTWYAYDARSYAMATFLIVLTQFLARKKSRWAAVCGAASFATYYFAALCVVPCLGLECIKRWKTDRTWVSFTIVSFGLCSAPLLCLLRVHLVARPHQYPGFSFLPREVWALLHGAMQGVMPNTWLPGWSVALFVGAFFAVAGAWGCIEKTNFALPLAYGAFLCGFFLLALVTNKSIVQMPAAYYLGIATPWLALLIGYGVREFPRLSSLLALAVIIGLIAARPIVRTVDYRQMVRRMKAECSHCPIVVGTGYVGAVPACVLYEARRMQVFLLKPDDSVNKIAERVGGRRMVFFVPTNEPPTAKIEAEFLRDYLSARKNGYFEVSVRRPPSLEQAASDLAGQRTSAVRKAGPGWVR